MARKSARQIVEELLALHEPIVRNAFLAAVDEIRSAIVLRVVIERLERGDIAGAVAALQVEAEAYGRLERAIAEAYYDGGGATVGNFPAVRDPTGNRVVFRFGIRNPASEAWLRDHSSRLVTRIVEDQREAIRFVLTAGLERGENPRQTALDVVGRVERGTNRRVGGIIGLTAQQARYVEAARRELLSGDPDAMRHYLTRARRDRRFDRSVIKAIRDGRRLDPDTVSRITGRYSDRLLELRGEMVAQNETQSALSKAREDAIRQQIAEGKVDADAVTKVWKHTPQENPRFHHRAMNGKSVGLDEQFELPNGARLSYPHAPDAPVGEKVFCKCLYAYKIDFFASVERRYRAAEV